MIAEAKKLPVHPWLSAVLQWYNDILHQLHLKHKNLLNGVVKQCMRSTSDNQFLKTSASHNSLNKWITVFFSTCSQQQVSLWASLSVAACPSQKLCEHIRTQQHQSCFILAFSWTLVEKLSNFLSHSTPQTILCLSVGPWIETYMQPQSGPLLLNWVLYC